MFHAFTEAAAIVVPLFSYVSSRIFWYVLFLVLHPPFSNLGLLLGSLGFSERATLRYSHVLGFFYRHRIGSDRAATAKAKAPATATTARATAFAG